MPATRMENRILTPANVVTIIRICLVPVFYVLYLYPWTELNSSSFVIDCLIPLICTLFFALISATDSLDGYLARSRNEVTNFGKFMDPLADKLLVIAAFLAFVEKGILPAWVCLIVLFREFLVSGLRMLAASKGEVIAASWYGKAKTVTQIVAICVFLLEPLLVFFMPDFSVLIHAFAWLVLLVSMVLTILSMIDYFIKGKHVFIEKPVQACALQCFEIVEPELDDCATPSDDQLYELAACVLNKCREAGQTLCSAESLTAGMISSTLAFVAGSSDVLRGGVVSYASEVKHEVLDVDASLLEKQGPVDASVASQMALGVAKTLNAHNAVAVTGIAGPGGGSVEKPVGTVWIALKTPKKSFVSCYHFSGERMDVRKKTTYTALKLLLDI